MVKFIKIVTFSIICLLMYGCIKKWFKDDELSLEREPYEGNSLRIDGYFYDKVDNKFYSIYFFFRNGIILYGGGDYTENEMIKKEKEYQTKDWVSHVKESKSRWGVFQINNNEIKFERWYPSNPPLEAWVRSGTILNDSTFIITKS